MKTSFYVLAVATILFPKSVTGDVNLRIVNHLTDPVVATVDSGTAPASRPLGIDIASKGSALIETSSGATWTFKTGNSVVKQYQVTDAEEQTVVLGSAPTLQRIFVNATTQVVDVVAIVPSKSDPTKLAQKILASLQPDQSSKSFEFYPRTLLQFMQDGKRVEPSYIVSSSNQESTHHIRGTVTRTIHNYTSSSVDISETNAEGTPEASRKVSSKRQLTLTTNVGSTLGFTTNGAPVAQPHSVTGELAEDINLGLKTPPAGNTPVTHPPTTDSNDPEWLAWVKETGSDYLNKPAALQKPLGPSNELWGRQYRHIPHCNQGYNVLKMDPRKPGTAKGTSKSTAVLFQQLDDGANWYVDQKYGTGILLPTYLRVRNVAGSTAQNQRHVYMSEAEHMNSWAVSGSATVKGVKAGFNYSHNNSSSQSRSQLSAETFELKWSDWAVLNKDQIVLDQQFKTRIQSLVGADEKEFFRFFDELGTHYPAATLFGGRKSVHQTASTDALKTSTESTWGVSLGVDYSNTEKDAASTTNTDDSGDEKTYGSLQNHDEMLPIRLVLAPLSELIRPQLVDVSDHAALRAAMDRHFETYQSNIAVQHDAEHHLLEITVSAYCESSDDWETNFNSYKSNANLSLYDLSGQTPAKVVGFPKSLFSEEGDTKRDVYAGTNVFEKTEHFAVTSEDELESFRFFATFFIQDYDKTRSVFEEANDFRDQSLPSGLTGTPDSTSLNQVLKGSAIDLRDVVALRMERDKIAEAAAANKDVRRIEGREFPGSASVLDGRLNEATGLGLDDYAALLREVKRLEALCQHLETHKTSGLGTIRYKLTIREATHPAVIDVDYPEPPFN